MYSIWNASNLIKNPRLTPILISRFLLNLRQLGEPENETQSRFNSRVSIPGFRVPTLESVVGNMGADLDHGPTKEVDEGADIPVNGGHLAEAALDGISENGPGVLVTENVYGNQEVGPPFLCVECCVHISPSSCLVIWLDFHTWTIILPHGTTIISFSYLRMHQNVYETIHLGSKVFPYMSLVFLPLMEGTRFEGSIRTSASLGAFVMKLYIISAGENVLRVVFGPAPPLTKSLGPTDNLTS